MKSTANNAVSGQNASFQCEVKETLLLDMEAYKKVTMCLRQVSCFTVGFIACKILAQMLYVQGVETFDTIVCELKNQRRNANRSAKNGQWVPHRRRTGLAVGDINLLELCAVMIIGIVN